MSYRPEPLPEMDEAPRRRRERGARLRREPGRGQLGGYGIRHAQVLVASLGRLWRHPVASLFSVAVIGIALALPAGMSVLVDNIRTLSGAWEGAARVSVFLKQDVDAATARKLTADVSREPGIKSVRLITADEALAEFRQRSGFGAALDVLDDNPLPAVLVVTPLSASSGAADQLADKLRQRPEVASVQLDSEWLQRLDGIIGIVHRTILIITALFALGVVIIIGNTIRLDIQNRRDEIEISKLIGATNRFIRRPFLYAGLWYGLGGGIAAWILVSASLWLLHGPVQYLAGLYGSQFSLHGLGAGSVFLLLIAGASLGWLGSWCAVARHLGEIEPA
ncbi:MAG TPA: permease-like cell division protein FtsX [Gammaproteobacteria bacterium]|nr:permease-like cell division protein FtsX [Gammaproteobacteria bacterium]